VIGVERGLREAEIHIGPLAGENELRRQQVKTFIPGEGAGLGVEQQPREKHGSRGQQVSQLPVLAGRGIVHQIILPFREGAALGPEENPPDIATRYRRILKSEAAPAGP